MKTLTFYQFLDIIEKTCCPRYTVRYVNGSWVYILGCCISDDVMLGVWKTRPFSLYSKSIKIVEKLLKYDKTFCNPEFIKTV